MSQSRLELEKNYWNENALDKEVDSKYIADVPTKLCLQDLGELEGRVLEIGCGVGRLLQDGWYGIDISTNMLQIAKQRQPNAKYLSTTGRTIPFKDNVFDNVYSYLVFQHLEPNAVKSYIDESYRVLKNGGMLTFQFITGTEREPFSNHYSKQEIKRFLAEWAEVTFKQSKAYKGWTICTAKK